jgi:hypothetical protein
MAAFLTAASGVMDFAGVFGKASGLARFMLFLLRMVNDSDGFSPPVRSGS